MARKNGSYSDRYYKSVIKEIKVLAIREGKYRALQAVREIANQYYLDMQLTVKNHQEKYGEWGVMDYYSVQNGLIVAYHKITDRSVEDWEKCFSNSAK